MGRDRDRHGPPRRQSRLLSDLGPPRPQTLLPFLDAGEAIVCDCKSGISGAGKKSDLAFSFSELSGNVVAYAAGTHRHEPEMRQQLGLPLEAPFVFVPHLIPAVRGIFSTIHVGFGAALTSNDLGEIYGRAYAASPLVDVLPAGVLPDLGSVVGTPRAAIGFAILRADGAPSSHVFSTIS